MNKINQLIKDWPKGVVMLTSYLKGEGYSKDLLKRYVNSNWLESLGYGAYKLSGDKVGWEGAINALQKQSSVHPGGKTALEMKGYAHFLTLGNKAIELFSGIKEPLPLWFLNQNWMKIINHYSTKLFQYNDSRMYINHEVKSISLKISSPELAILELLYLVPKEHSFNEANLIMESLTTLRAELLQSLLEKCNSVKVKRMFLFLAERHRHSWFEDLDQTKIYLGSGKREIVKRGRLNKKYSITVPQEYEE